MLHMGRESDKTFSSWFWILSCVHTVVLLWGSEASQYVTLMGKIKYAAVLLCVWAVLGTALGWNRNKQVKSGKGVFEKYGACFWLDPLICFSLTSHTVGSSFWKKAFRSQFRERENSARTSHLVQRVEYMVTWTEDLPPKIFFVQFLHVHSVCLMNKGRVWWYSPSFGYSTVFLINCKKESWLQEGWWLG